MVIVLAGLRMIILVSWSVPVEEMVKRYLFELICVVMFRVKFFNVTLPVVSWNTFDAASEDAMQSVTDE